MTLRAIIKNIAPYGVTCAWKRKRYGVVEDLPLFHYLGLSKRIRRIVKFSLPYGFVSSVKLPFDSHGAQDPRTVALPGVECLGGLAGLSGVPAGLTRALRPKVLIVAELVIAQLRYYRVEQKVCMLREAGIAVEVESWTDVAACVRGLQTATCVIVYRAPYSEELKAIYAEARRLGLRIAYDTDDLVFEESAMKANPAFANLSAAERRKLAGMARPYREALAAADFPIASTAALAEAMSRHCRGRTHIVPNAICEELLSPPFRYPTAVGGEVVIGYGAGSATHDADFGQCSGALVRVLEKFPGTVLVIHGSLVLPREFDRFVARIRRVPFVPFSEYANALARLDINLIPLERNLFNDCKSNIKYLEASRLGVVSVASPCAEFASVIRNGENGFLAANEQDWYEALSRLVSDADLRRRMGEAARRTAHERFDGDVVWRTCLQPALDDLTAGSIAGRRILYVTDGDGRPPSSDKGEIVSVLSLTDDKRITFPVRTERNGCNEFRVPYRMLATALDEVLGAFRPDEVLFDRVGRLEAAELAETFAKRGTPYAIVVRDGWWLCSKGFVPGTEGCPGRPDGVVDLYTCSMCCADCKNLFLRWNRLTSALKGAKEVRAADAALRDVYRANGMTVN